MFDNQDDSFSLIQLLVRRWRLIIAVPFACVGLAGLVTMNMARQYQSRMKFLVNTDRADLVLTPQKDGASNSRMEISETEVNSEIELLRSRDILEAIVRAGRLYQQGEEKPPRAPSRLAIERAVIGLSQDLNVSAMRKTNIIQVTYRAPDPDRALHVLEDLGDRYLSAHLSAHTASGTDKFFAEQVQKYGTELARVRDALSVFHRQHQIFSISQQQGLSVARMEEVDAQMRNVDAQLQEERIRLAEGERQRAKTSERITTQIRSHPYQGAIEHLETSVTDMRNRRIELATKFKPTDRLIVELDAQIQNTAEALREAQASHTSERTTDVDTLYQTLRSDLAKGEIAIRGLEARRTELSAIRQGYLNKLAAMDASYVELQSMEQKEREAQDNHQLYTRRLEEARLAQSLDREKFSNVVLIERPVSSPLPVSPKLSKNLMLGAMMGVLLAVTFAFLFDDGSKPRSRGRRII